MRDQTGGQVEGLLYSYTAGFHGSTGLQYITITVWLKLYWDS